jgi:hypothetical protein
MFTNQVKGVAVGRNAGDGKTGDRYHVAVTYREDDEDRLHVIAGLEREVQAWAIVGLIASAKMDQAEKDYQPFTQLPEEARNDVERLLR